MNPAILDSIIYIAAGSIAAGSIQIIHLRPGHCSPLFQPDKNNMVVHSLGTPLVMLAFFIPLFLAVQHLLFLYPQYQWITDSKILASGYILVGT